MATGTNTCIFQGGVFKPSEQKEEKSSASSIETGKMTCEDLPTTEDIVWTLYGVPRAVKEWRTVCQELLPNKPPRRTCHLFLRPSPNLPPKESVTQRYIRKVEQKGEFFCPACLKICRFKEKSIFLSSPGCLFGSPSTAGTSDDDVWTERYVKCSFCRRHFDPLALKWGKPESDTVMETATLVGMAKVLAKPGDTTIRATSVSQIYESITGRTVKVDKVKDCVESRPSSGDTSLDFTAYRRFLNEDEKLMILRTLFETIKLDRNENTYTIDSRPSFLVVAAVTKGLGISLYRTEKILADVEAVHSTLSGVGDEVASSKETAVTSKQEEKHEEPQVLEDEPTLSSTFEIDH